MVEVCRVEGGGDCYGRVGTVRKKMEGFDGRIDM